MGGHVLNAQQTLTLDDPHVFIATSPVPQGHDKLFEGLGKVECLVEAYAAVAKEDRAVQTATLSALVHGNFDVVLGPCFTALVASHAPPPRPPGDVPHVAPVLGEC